MDSVRLNVLASRRLAAEVEYLGRYTNPLKLQCSGLKGFPYPADSTVQVSDKKGTVLSREFESRPGVPSVMPHSILWIGQRGVYIHGYPMLEDSHGCIHLLLGDAPEVFEWVDTATRILFKWV
jgi:hypothetical protein